LPFAIVMWTQSLVGDSLLITWTIMIVKTSSGFREIIKSIILLYFIKFTGRQFAFSYFFFNYIIMVVLSNEKVLDKFNNLPKFY